MCVPCSGGAILLIIRLLARTHFYYYCHCTLCLRCSCVDSKDNGRAAAFAGSGCGIGGGQRMAKHLRNGSKETERVPLS